MKKLSLSLCMLGLAGALSACGTGYTEANYEQNAPYSMERTASHSIDMEKDMKSQKRKVEKVEKVRSAEPMFEEKMRK